jgi:phenylalanine-4-hydroxylase
MMKALSLSDGGIPDMQRLSDRLQKITGWRVVPVAGLVPDEVFFNHLANRRFPAGAFIRPEEELDYLQERTSFATFLAMCRCWRTPFLQISWLPTARADSERCSSANWQI